MQTGHVLGNVVQVLVILVLITGIAPPVAFRPNATPVEWVAVLGLMLLLASGLSRLSAAMGLRAKTIEAASNAPTPLPFLPFLGGAVIMLDSMPAALGWFAEYQPFTPINETPRGLLLGTEIGNDAWITPAWCVGPGVVGGWARSAFGWGVQR